MASADRPRVLVSLGVAAWQRWIEPFLHDPAFDAECFVPGPRGESFLRKVREERYDAAVFLSQHGTLRRDLNLARRLTEAGVEAIACQPQSVARLARHKRSMAEHAKRIDGLESIPELSQAEAREELESGRARAIIAKRGDGTEGAGMRIIRRPVELGATATRLREAGYLLQPFLEGEEISVNLAWFGGRCNIYPPVVKGNTSLDGPHPSRRLRVCPAPLLHEEVWRELRSACVRFLVPFRPSGLVEMEFIRCGNRFYLLEVNPRLAATVRLTAAASASNPLVDLVKATCGLTRLGLAVHASRHAEEWALPDTLAPDLRRELEARPYVWMSTRITVAADDPVSLAARTADLRQRLQGSR